MKNKEFRNPISTRVSPMVEKLIVGDRACSVYMNQDLRTVTQWRYKNYLPYHKVGGKVYYNTDELDQILSGKYATIRYMVDGNKETLIDNTKI